MSRPIEKGSFVVHEKHPEHGLGRVLSVGEFATRVLFQSGGVRVYRASALVTLKSVLTPAPADAEALAAKELALASGEAQVPIGATKPAPPKARKPRARKTPAV